MNNYYSIFGYNYEISDFLESIKLYCEFKYMNYVQKNLYILKLTLSYKSSKNLYLK